MTKLIRFAAGLCLVGVASCRFEQRDDRHAVGEYALQTVDGKALPTGKDVRLALVESGTTTLNADHTFSERESIRIIGGSTTNWKSSGTWTLNGDKLVKVHNTAEGPVTELAIIVGDTLEAGSSVLVRK